MMDELITLVDEVSNKLTEISVTLTQISAKLDTISDVYGIDDVIAKLDSVTDDITGPSGYNLTDIFKELSDLNMKT